MTMVAWETRADRRQPHNEGRCESATATIRIDDIRMVRMNGRDDSNGDRKESDK